MTWFLCKLDDSSGIVILAKDAEDAQAKAFERRLNPNASVLSTVEL